MTGPITDHVLAGTHGTSAECVPWPDNPARQQRAPRRRINKTARLLSQTGGGVAIRFVGALRLRR